MKRFPKELVELVASKIWRETFYTNTFMHWHELKKGQFHHKLTMNAAKSVLKNISEYVKNNPDFLKQYVDTLEKHNAK